MMEHSPIAEGVDEQERRLTLADESLVATTRPVAGGAVRITKRVVSTDRGRDLPATDEQIRVERRIVDRPGATGEMQSFEQIIIEIPIERDGVDVRQDHSTEEIIVTKETVHRVERVTGTVRREALAIDGEPMARDTPQNASARPD